MRQFTLLLVTVTILMAVVVLLSPMPFANAVDVQSSVQLGGTAGPTCGLQIVSGSPINYGQLTTANAIATDRTLRVQNTGTSPATALTALGTNWINPAVAGAPAVMNVGTTHVASVANVAYASKTALGPTPVNILSAGQTFGGGASLDTFWQVQFVLSAGVTFTGTASQTVTLATTC